MNLHTFQHSGLSSKPHFLLLGNPVAHSLSPPMHNKAAEIYGLDVRYHAINLQSNELSSLAAHLNKEAFQGANITIPYKQILIDYVDELDPVSRAFGAINTVVKEPAKLAGYNTDVHGFSVPLKEFSDEIEGGRSVIFGTGGASKAIAYALRESGMEEIVLISRNPGSTGGYPEGGQVRVASYDAWPELVKEACLIVNATPLGMEPDINSSPVRDHEVQLLSGKICYDIVYKPIDTRFLKQARTAGARTIGGLEMLIHQGSRAFELWTGKPFPLDEVRSYLHEHVGR